MPDLTYDRKHIRRRYKIYIARMKTWREDILGLIRVLVESNNIEKANKWTILYHSLLFTEDLWQKLVDDL